MTAMQLRPSEPEIVEDREFGLRWIVKVDGSPLRYYNRREEAEAFVDGFNYIWMRD